MTVKQLTDYLYEAGYGSDKVVFRICGEISHTEEILHSMSGDYEFTAELDHECRIEDVDCRQDGKVVVTLEIAAIYT